MAERVKYWIVYARKTDRVIIYWQENYGTPDEKAAQLAKDIEQYGENEIVIAITKRPPYPKGFADASRNTDRSYERRLDDPKYYIWPDGTLTPLNFQDYVDKSRRLTEDYRHVMDLEPVPVKDDIGVDAASYPHWAGLRYLSQRHRTDPAFPFKKILLRKVLLSSGDPEGLYEVASIGELHRIVDTRADRHNALHNARHVVDIDVNALIDRMADAFARAYGKSNDAAFIAARVAFEEYDISARMIAESALEKQTPSPLDIASARAQAVSQMQAAAAARLSALTGETHSWLTLLAVTAYRTRDLIALVGSAAADINAADTRESIERAREHWTKRIGDWGIPVDVTITHSLEAERRIRLNVQVTTASYVKVQMLYATGQGFEKVGDDEHRVYANGDRTERQAFIDFTGLGIQSGFFYVDLLDAADDRNYVALITVAPSATAAPSMSIHHTVGAVNAA